MSIKMIARIWSIRWACHLPPFLFLGLDQRGKAGRLDLNHSIDGRDIRFCGKTDVKQA